MTDLEKAARMALEALNGSQHRMKDYDYQAMETTIAANNDAITALRQALEQPAQEPCPQCKGLGYYDEGHENDDGTMSGGNYVECEKCKAPAQQEPVDWEAVAADQAMTIAMMKAERKPWVELDHDDIHHLVNEFFYRGMQPTGIHFANFGRAIEAKLREKNT